MEDYLSVIRVIVDAGLMFLMTCILIKMYSDSKKEK